VIITLGSIRGAPGVTSWAVLLAAAWPPTVDVERVVLEADPAGGVLGARFQIGVDPGLPQFLAGLRRSDEPTPNIDRFARMVSDHIWIIPAPETGERTRAVLGSITDDIARRLADDQRIWFVDTGRLDDTNPSIALLNEASLAVLVVGSRTEDLVQVPSCVERLQKRCARTALIVSGQTPFTEAELVEFSAADVVWIVGDRNDLAAGAALALAGRRGRRTWAWRQALDVASAAAAMVPIGTGSLLKEHSVEVGP
jgi:hypothetical protein